MTSTFKLRGITDYFWETYVRPIVLKRDNYACVLCGNKKRLEVHETDYRNITINTLQTLCKPCHKKNP